MVQRFIIETRFLNPRVGDNPTKTSCNTGGSPHEIERQHFTYDVAEALQAETGKFEVTSPNGERYFITCQPGHSIVSLEWAGSEPNLQPFLVRKVAQPITTEGRTKRSAAA